MSESLTRYLHFFSLPREFAETMVTALGDRFAVLDENGDELTIVQDKEAALLSGRRLFLAESLAAPTAFSPGTPIGDLGFVQIVPPQIEDDVLLMTEISTKATTPSAPGPSLFRLVQRRWEPMLQRPIWARPGTGGPARQYRDVGYTAAAGVWAQSGRLMARRVPNVVYLTGPDD